MPSIFLFVVIIVLASLAFPFRYVFADPHAMFYTDRGQEQLFFNVLAALNQADYVEPPYGHDGAPTLEDVDRMGQYIRTGTPPSPRPSPTITRDTDGNVVSRDPALEPEEASELPRIRVRQVTADDGDVYYREFLQQRATVEQQRVELSNLICNFTALYWGTEHATCLENMREGGFNVASP